jgi:hypothetical protein
MVSEMVSEAATPSVWRSPTAWLAIVASVAIVLLGLRAIIDPVAASAGFGLPMQTATETTFVQIYGSRNALLGAISLLLAALGLWRAVAVTFSCACALPLFDAALIVSHHGVGAVLVRHGVILAILIAISALLWRFAVKAPDSARA